MSTAAPVLDHQQHVYALDGKPLLSVSKVINALIKKSFDGADEAVLKNAAERGSLVEQYATEILRTGSVTPQTNERNDVLERLECFERWYLHHEPELMAAQQMVWSELDGTAGTLDWRLKLQGKRYITDLKCTSQPERTWILQLGAYVSMSEEEVDGCAILHINPKYAQGYIWREYDPLQAEAYWHRALAWYRTLEHLKAEALLEG